MAKKTNQEAESTLPAPSVNAWRISAQPNGGHFVCDEDPNFMFAAIRPGDVMLLLDATGEKAWGARRVFLSLGSRGVFAAQRGQSLLVPACQANAVNATGAGDAMLAALVWSYLAGGTLAESAAAGAAAAALTVESAAAVNPSLSAAAVSARMALSE